jgi:hypothetical protein
MKPSSWDKQLGLALPLKSAASQSDETNNPSKHEVRYEVGAGCKSPHPHLPEGRGEVFFLDILFHRMSVIEILRQLRKPWLVWCHYGELCRREGTKG